MAVSCYLLNGRFGVNWSPFVHSVARFDANLTSVTAAASDNDDDAIDDEDGD